MNIDREILRIYYRSTPNFSGQVRRPDKSEKELPVG